MCILAYVFQSLIEMRSPDSEFCSFLSECPRVLPRLNGCDLPYKAAIHVDVWYFCLISFIIKRFISFRNDRKHNLKPSNFSPANIFFANKTSKIRQLISTILLFIVLCKFLMIAIINPSISHPGPRNISVFYQNVQGFIPIRNLGEVNPDLNRNKILELNTHINTHKPDVVLLNETWLVKSIHSREVIENNVYNVFRCDRSQLSHPSDPSDPEKFKKSGGGVLIAVRSDMEASSKRISLANGAEIIAIEVNVNGVKHIFCTCYRVDTLRAVNHDSIKTSIARFFKSKKPKRIFIIGDFNLNTVKWPLDDHTSVHRPTDNLFIDTFNDFGLSQCINCPTHIKGKTLDLLLSNHIPLITNLNVLEHNSVVKSDHFPIIFQIKSKVKHKKVSKRKILNFKRADWDALNQELCRVNWDAILDRTEPEVAWNRFKSQLFSLTNKHIPTISIKSEFQPPWFDSESYQACLAKNNARKKFKRTKAELDELNFKHLRREFKKLSSQKMRDNMYNSDDPALITK